MNALVLLPLAGHSVMLLSADWMYATNGLIVVSYLMTMRILEQSCSTGDAESCLYLAYIYHGGNWSQHDEAKAKALLEKAAAMGSAQAREASQQASLPPFVAPRVLSMPSWRGGPRSPGT